MLLYREVRKWKKNYSILYAEDDINVRKNYVVFLESYFDRIYEAGGMVKRL